MAKKEYRSSIRSKKMIRDAFIKLMKEKPINKITVTDIINEANINRSTFYAHFLDVRNVVESFEDEIFSNMNNLLSEFEFKSFFSNPLPILLTINRYLEDDIEFYRTLIIYKNETGFLDKFSKTFYDYLEQDESIPEKIRKSTSFELRLNIFAGGMMQMYEKWFKKEINCPLNDLSMEMAKIIKGTSKSLINYLD